MYCRMFSFLFFNIYISFSLEIMLEKLKFQIPTKISKQYIFISIVFCLLSKRGRM